MRKGKRSTCLTVLSQLWPGGSSKRFLSLSLFLCRLSQCSPGWRRTSYVVQAGFKLPEIHLSSPPLKACTSYPGFSKVS